MPTVVEVELAEIIVQQWGEDFAILVPRALGTEAGLSAGDKVDVSMRQGDLLLRRLRQEANVAARKAAEDMIAESRNYTLGTSVRVLLDEGRRG